MGMSCAVLSRRQGFDESILGQWAPLSVIKPRWPSKAVCCGKRWRTPKYRGLAVSHGENDMASVASARIGNSRLSFPYRGSTGERNHIRRSGLSVNQDALSFLVLDECGSSCIITENYWQSFDLVGRWQFSEILPYNVANCLTHCILAERIPCPGWRIVFINGWFCKIAQRLFQGAGDLL